MTLPPIAAWSDAPANALARLRGVLTDIDDTLTREGEIEPEALAALHRLAAAGLPVIAITGRPAGWSEPFARVWPVAAIVAENGGVMLRRQHGLPAAASLEAPLLYDYMQDAATRAANFRRLQACAQAVLAEVPGTVLARDSAGRLTDIAVDHSEFVHLAPEAIDRVVALMRAHGLQATVSSIHINGWIGGHNKWTAAQWAVQQVLGEPFDPARWLYVGDSTNDQLMFERVPLSVGVANIARFLPQLAVRPAFVTQAERGHGFAEVAERLLRVKAPGSR